MTTKQTESVPAGETGTLKGVGEKLSSSLSIAQSYTELRLCLLPLQHKEKIPDGKSLAATGIVNKKGETGWESLQERLPTADEITIWFNNGNLNLGIILGEVSDNKICLDFDTEDEAQQWAGKYLAQAKTWNQKTSRGKHFIFKTTFAPKGVKALSFIMA